MPMKAEDIISYYETLGVKAGSPVAVAVSGGADSLCLLLVTAPHFDVTAITVDHGLREESADEAQFVAKLCASKGIKHISMKWDGDKPGSNIQSEARIARYTLMRDWCAEHSIPYLAVAHHRDDQAETLLLRLERGSGVYGLAAMPARRELGKGVSIVRPFLSVAKASLVEALEDMGQAWVEDPSNNSDAYARSRVRKFLENPPLEGLTPERLAATAGRLRRSREALEHYEQLWLEKAVTICDGGYLLLSKDQLEAEPEEIILRGLATICRFFNDSGYVPRMEKLLRLRGALLSTDFTGHTLYGARFSRSKGGQILISRELAAVDGEIPLEESVIWDNRFAICAKGGISGLKIAALGADGWLKLKALMPDLSRNIVPRSAGLVLPAIYKEAELQAVPHMGYDILEGVEIKLSLKMDTLTKK